jgi:peptidoglycan glycosyltransferase
MINRQIQRVFSFFVALFVIITGYLVYWQVVQADAVSDSDFRICVSGDQPVRGKIFDRNGVLLAYSEEDPRSPCGWRRRYTTDKHPSISSFLGYFNYNYGSTGIEKFYNNELMGRGEAGDFNNDAQQYWNRLTHRTFYGNNIYLTIDIRIQDQLEKLYGQQPLGGACVGGPLGSFIVSNPQTGEILGMLSLPYYNGDTIGDTTPPNDGSGLTKGQQYWKQINSDKNSPLVNRAMQGRYVPGSVFKMLTLSAGLDSGIYTTSSTFTEDEARKVVVDGHPITSNNLDDYKDGPKPPQFPLNLEDAFAYSDNVAFARMGLKIGGDTLTSYARRFGIGTPSQPIDIPIDSSPSPQSFLYTSDGTLASKQTLLADTSFGQGQLSITPLTIAIITDTIANNGVLVVPHFLQKVVPYNGNPQVIANREFPSSQLISASAAQYLRQSMRGVMLYGSVGVSGKTISSTANTSALIAGKSGSAQLESGNSHAWFASLTTSSSYPKQLASLVMKERAGSGSCLAPIASKLYDAVQPLVK